jgi:hypothetical protein
MEYMAQLNRTTRRSGVSHPQAIPPLQPNPIRDALAPVGAARRRHPLRAKRRPAGKVRSVVPPSLAKRCCRWSWRR